MDSFGDNQEARDLIRRDSGSGLRVSDAERDVAAAELGDHFQAGRLDQAEFDERLTVALRARTRGELAGLLTDLPSPPPADPGRAPAYRLVPALIPLLFAALIAIGVATRGGASHHGPGPWPLLWLWWLIPIAVFRIRSSRARGHRGTWR